MRKTLFGIFLLLAGLSTFVSLNAQTLITFPDIPGRTASDKYLCRVRMIDSSEWKNAFVIQTTCKNNPEKNVPPTGPDNGYFEILDGWSASFISFEFENTSVEVEISKVGGAPISKAMVRPVGHASAADIRDGKVYVVFNRNANINVDIDGQMEDNYTGMDYAGPKVHTISLFGNPVYKVPSTTNQRVISLNPGDTIPLGTKTSWDTIYFQPGVHNIGAPYTIYSNKVLHLPGNAIVHGTIHPKNAWGNDASKDWSVYGSGALSSENILWTGDDNKSAKSFTYQAEGARLEGFVVMDPANHTFNMGHTGPDAKVNVYKNLKIFGWRKNSDGINAFRNSVITDCFLRCQDDVFYYGGNNVKISNIVTWNDANGAVMFVTKGAATMDTSYFKDIKVIYHRASYHYWEGGRVISFRDRKPGDDIRNVQIRNVLIEDPKSAFPPFYLKMLPNGTATGITMNNIVIENVRQEHPAVTVPGRDATRNTMLGLDATRKFKNITFQNCYYNGKWLGSFADGNFLINSFVENIAFVLDSVKHQVTVSVNDSTLGTATGSGIYTHGKNATLTAVPKTGYVLKAWMVGTTIVSKSLTYTFPVVKDVEVKAVFILAVYHNITLAVNNNTGGTVSGGGTYLYDTEITVKAVPDAEYVFTKWLVDTTTVSTNAEYKFTVVKDLTLKAVFSLKPPSSINNLSDTPFSLYPNPATDMLFFNSNGTVINKIEMVDLTGKVIYSNSTVDENETIDLEAFKIGLYFVLVHTPENVYTTKLMIK